VAQLKPDGTPVPGITGAQPILLTRRKDRKRTLPMEVGLNDESPSVTPVPATAGPPPPPSPGSVPAEAWPADEEDDWTDIDIDAEGSGG
jgi:hypothetical protein